MGCLPFHLCENIEEKKILLQVRIFGYNTKTNINKIKP